MRLEPIPNSIGEDLQRWEHPCGLTVLLNPRAGFTRTFAVMATHFGSLDSEVRPPDGQATFRVPDGVAHFLEHKLFEDRDGDVSLRFSERGASCNAATEFTKTSYHFSCVDNLDENLETLLRFVFDPYFTAETVAKEQGIIEQEIRMYDDDPDWVVFFRLLEGLYHRHPVRLNIAGSVESIHQITPEILYRCHQVFYHPRNMVLAVAGGFEVEEVCRCIDGVLAQLPAVPGRSHRRTTIDEPRDIRQRLTDTTLSVARPQVLIGYKDKDLEPDAPATLRRELVTRLLLDVLFADSSSYHQQLYESGVIDDSFEASYCGEHDFGFTLIGGEADDPEGFVRAIQDVLDQARRASIAPDAFERCRRKFLGRYVRAFNSAESVAGTLVNCHFRGLQPDDLLRIVEQLGPEDLQARLESHLREEVGAVSVLRPAGNGRTETP